MPGADAPAGYPSFWHLASCTLCQFCHLLNPGKRLQLVFSCGKDPGFDLSPMQDRNTFLLFSWLSSYQRGLWFLFPVCKREEGLLRWHGDKESSCQCRDTGSIHGLGRSLGEGNPQSHRQRSLAGYSPWGYRELDMTEHRPYIQRESQVTPLLKTEGARTLGHWLGFSPLLGGSLWAAHGQPSGIRGY